MTSESAFTSKDKKNCISPRLSKMAVFGRELFSALLRKSCNKKQEIDLSKTTDTNLLPRHLHPSRGYCKESRLSELEIYMGQSMFSGWSSPA